MSVSATFDTSARVAYGIGRKTGGCEISERLLDIASDTSKSAQQRISEATAYAGTAGWEALAVFALAPDLIRHVQLHCGDSTSERLILQIMDAEDGNERLHVSFIGPSGDWDRIL